MQSSLKFNEVCGSDGGSGYTLGCYYRDSNNKEHIDIYNHGIDIINENGISFSFTDSRKITSLHEMLHAVYDRFDEQKKSAVCTELRDITGSISALRDKLSNYSENQYCTEAFARVGAEYITAFNINDDVVADLDAKLSYSQKQSIKSLVYVYDDYFDCTQKETVMAYWRNKKQFSDYNAKIDTERSSINSEKNQIQALINDYYRWPTWSKYNNVTARINAYNNRVKNYKKLIATLDKIEVALDSERHYSIDSLSI